VPPDIACPVCAKRHGGFLRRTCPVHQNLLASDARSALLFARTLAMHICHVAASCSTPPFSPSCSTTASATTIPRPAPARSRSCRPLVRTMVNTWSAQPPDRRGRLRQGGFLTQLSSTPAREYRVGYDPSYLEPRTCSRPAPLCPRVLRSLDGNPAEVVVCRHVIEHIERPLALLQAIRLPCTRVPRRGLFETPCVSGSSATRWLDMFSSTAPCSRPSRSAWLFAARVRRLRG